VHGAPLAKPSLLSLTTPASVHSTSCTNWSQRACRSLASSPWMALPRHCRAARFCPLRPAIRCRSPGNEMRALLCPVYEEARRPRGGGDDPCVPPVRRDNPRPLSRDNGSQPQPPTRLPLARAPRKRPTGTGRGPVPQGDTGPAKAQVRPCASQYSGMGGAAGFFFSGMSPTIASVLTSRPATLAPFWSAVRTTLVGSTMPRFTRSQYSALAAS